MPSWRARCFKIIVRIYIRRRKWGKDEQAVARRARRLFGAPMLFQLSLAGDSAGAGLVLATLLRARDEGLPLPACAVCFSPWTDLAGTGASVRFNDGLCAMFRAENIAEFASAYLGDASPFEMYASPAFADLGGLPPLLLQVGSTELLLDDTRCVHHKIQEAKGISRLEVYDDVLHGWQMLDGIVPEARLALWQAAAFICEHVSPTDGACVLLPV
jgi:monoterpene epsilon-lactone hydrolase